MILRRKYSSNRGMSGQIAGSDIAVPIKWLLPARTPAIHAGRDSAGVAPKLTPMIILANGEVGWQAAGIQRYWISPLLRHNPCSGPVCCARKADVRADGP
jgi:hypothetical protein